MLNRFRRTISILLISTLCVTSLGLTAFAEETTEDVSTPVSAIDVTSSKVDHVEYSLAGDYPEFNWNKVELSSGAAVRYAFRCWTGSSSYSSGKKFVLKTGIKKTSYTATKGFNVATYPYYFQVTAYANGSEPNWNGAITTTINKPEGADIAPATNVEAEFTYPKLAKNTKKLGEIKQKDNGVTVTWDVADPSLYSRFEVFRVNSKGTRTLVGTTKVSAKTSYSNKHYSLKGTFSFVVRAYLKSDSYHSVYVESAPSEAFKINFRCVANDVDGIKSNVSWNVKALKKISLYKTPGGKKVATIAKNTKLPATYGYAPEEFAFWDEPTWVEVKYKGEKVWAKWSQVKMCWCITHNDYAWSVKEDFINSEDVDSNSDYLIWISRYTQRTNIFHKEGKKWKLIKVYDCNTGNYYQPLKGGQYYIKGHELKKIKEHRDGRLYYFMYSTKFGGSGTFHTRCRWVDTNGLRNAIKRHPTTKGCCRLYDAAAQYVYYNMPIGTGVYIH